MIPGITRRNTSDFSSLSAGYTSAFSYSVKNKTQVWAFTYSGHNCHICNCHAGYIKDIN